MEANLKCFVKTTSLNTIFILILIFVNYLIGDKDYRMVFAHAYLIFFALSFYLGQNKKGYKTLIILLIGIGLTYLISSFITALLIGILMRDHQFGGFVMIIISSLFSSVMLTVLLNKIYGINRIYLTILSTTIIAILANFITFKFGQYISIYMFTISDRFLYLNQSQLIFIIWNLLVVIPLAFGLNIKLKTK